MINDKQQPIEINLGTGRAAREQIGESASLVFSPEDRSVTLFRRIGSGTPMGVWHGRARTLCLQPSMRLEDVEAYLKEGHLDEIEDLFALYEGKEWDGHNHIGSWSDADKACEILDSIDQSLHRSDNIGRYWEASDYLAGGKAGVMHALASLLREGKSLDEAIEARVEVEVDQASGNGVILDEDEVRKALQAWSDNCEEVEEAIDEHFGKVADPFLTPASRACLESVGDSLVDVGHDVRRLVQGEVDRDELLEQCIDGAEASSVEGWTEYVAAVAAAAKIVREKEARP